MSALPHIGLIVAGGTITALAEDPFEINDYGDAGSLSPDALLERAFDEIDETGGGGLLVRDSTRMSWREKV